MPHFPSKPRPTSFETAPHFPSESVPHFVRNPHSRNLLFCSGRQMDEIFQALIDRTRGPLDLDRIGTIFGDKSAPTMISGGRIPPDGEWWSRHLRMT